MIETEGGGGVTTEDISGGGERPRRGIGVGVEHDERTREGVINDRGDSGGMGGDHEGRSG